ncbi:MAG: hypothetical protein NC251_11515 [Lachnoclostridium sp.]|nr:hypothetical protein [Lachnospira sp.]MCM1249045.1 hypothetical protein [Lachnoclostridium sp.]MCM1535871.1 hypothetical protein [Clostridium sp.]
MKKSKRNEIIIFGVFVLVVLLQLARITYVFAVEREGFHSDETWSYGFANSYYEPYLYAQIVDPERKQPNVDRNLMEWVSGDVFREYLTVGEDERFSYGSVYYNLIGDLGLPLHEMLLHTICSFFPGSFSWWYSYAINIVFFLLCQLVLFLWIKRFSGSALTALMVTVYYGFTNAALNCYIYLRSYAMLTVFAITLVYMLCSMYRKEFAGIKKELAVTFVITLLGGFTHYYFFTLAFFLTAFTCIYLLVRKKWKEMFTYGLTMLFGVVVDLVAFPYILSHMQSGPDLYATGASLPYYWDFSACMTLLLGESFGFGWKIDHITFLYAAFVVFWIVFLTAVVFILFRNEQWLIRIRGKIWAWLRDWRTHLKWGIEHCNWFAVICLAAIVANTAIIAKISNVMAMGVTTDRYLFYMMPVLIGIFMVFIGRICKKAIKKRVAAVFAAAAVMTGFLLCSNIRSGCYYLFKTFSENPSLTELTSGADCVIVSMEAWRMTWYSSEMPYVNQFAYVLDNDCMDSAELMNEYAYSSRTPVYFILEKSIFVPEENEQGSNLMGINVVLEGENLVYEKDYINYLIENVDWIDSMEKIDERNSFCGFLSVYRVN